MVNKERKDWLTVNIFNGHVGSSPTVYDTHCPDLADAQFHIDDYKNNLDRRSTSGLLGPNAYATMTWYHSDICFICDSWSC